MAPGYGAQVVSKRRDKKTTLGVIRFISSYNSAIAVPREINRAGNEEEARGGILTALLLQARSRLVQPALLPAPGSPAQDGTAHSVHMNRQSRQRPTDLPTGQL